MKNLTRRRSGTAAQSHVVPPQPLRKSKLKGISGSGCWGLRQPKMSMIIAFGWAKQTSLRIPTRPQRAVLSGSSHSKGTRQRCALWCLLGVNIWAFRRISQSSSYLFMNDFVYANRVAGGPSMVPRAWTLMKMNHLMPLWFTSLTSSRENCHRRWVFFVT